MSSGGGHFILWVLGVAGAALTFMGSVPPAQVRRNFEEWFRVIDIGHPEWLAVPAMNLFQVVGILLLTFPAIWLWLHFVMLPLSGLMIRRRGPNA